MTLWALFKQYVKNKTDPDKILEQSKKREAIARQKAREYKALKREADARKSLSNNNTLHFGDDLMKGILGGETSERKKRA